MNCPFCEHGETKVVDSRVAGKGAIRRRRECLLCAQRFTTFERIEETPLFVVKRDGSRQPFDRGQAAGRPGARLHQAAGVARADRAGAATRSRRACETGSATRSTSQAIGDEALAVLHDLDRVAYVRFASVYRDFQDVEEFERELARMELGRTSVRRDG